VIKTLKLTILVTCSCFKFQRLSFLELIWIFSWTFMYTTISYLYCSFYGDPLCLFSMLFGFELNWTPFPLTCLFVALFSFSMIWLSQIHDFGNVIWKAFRMRMCFYRSFSLFGSPGNYMPTIYGCFMIYVCYFLGV